MKKKLAGKFRTKEEWRVIRAMVEQQGMTLTAAAEKAGIPYSTVQERALIECWNPPQGIIRGRPRDTEILAAQAKRIEQKLAREQALLVAETALVKVPDLEVRARKILKADSARANVMASRVVTAMLSRLEDPTIPPRSATQALGALAPIFRLVYWWGGEPVEPAVKPTQAINLALIQTSPAELAAMGKAKRGSSPETEHSGQEHGTLSVQPEQPERAGDDQPIPKNEAPHASADRTGNLERAVSSLTPVQTKQDSQGDPPSGHPPFSNPLNEPEARREPFEGMRCEHHKDIRERAKYR